MFVDPSSKKTLPSMSFQDPATAKRSNPLSTYLGTSIFGLEQWTEDLFSRYKAAGTSCYDLAFAIRTRTYLQELAVVWLEKSFTVTPGNQTLKGIGDGFFYVIRNTTLAKRALGEAHELVNNIGGDVDYLYRDADLHLDTAFDQAILLDASINAIERCLMVAMNDPMLDIEPLSNEETPDPMIEAQLRVVAFERWAGVVDEWTARVDRYLAER